MWLRIGESAPLLESKVLGWWPNWGGMIHIVHFDGKSWILGSQKVMAPTHYRHMPAPPPTGPRS